MISSKAKEPKHDSSSGSSLSDSSSEEDAKIPSNKKIGSGGKKPSKDKMDKEPSKMVSKAVPLKSDSDSDSSSSGSDGSIKLPAKAKEEKKMESKAKDYEEDAVKEKLEVVANEDAKVVEKDSKKDSNKKTEDLRKDFEYAHSVLKVSNNDSKQKNPFLDITIDTLRCKPVISVYI
eukprot:TRINITY_DN8880_c0_g3_i2.p1 TRINITY_DN8880_c0_g3~~TRINITY_DN8880_c0_g3_i2.p1  ORF type:complete len:199 (-),score=45.91 TRINITY_DN8880_c0_g3_i2:896-1423(-)